MQLLGQVPIEKSLIRVVSQHGKDFHFFLKNPRKMTKFQEKTISEPKRRAIRKLTTEMESTEKITLEPNSLQKSEMLRKKYAGFFENFFFFVKNWQVDFKSVKTFFWTIPRFPECDSDSDNGI